MVVGRRKSIVIGIWQSLSITDHFTFPHILYHLHPLCAVCSVHKQATRLYSDERVRSCNVLNIKRYLVAGGGIEPPTLGVMNPESAAA